MKKKVLVVWKNQGQTPLEVIEHVKKALPDLQNEKISYAGRLDPMAEGLLLLLLGDENKKRKGYEGLKKVYETEVVFGITTDSYDGLGLVKKVSSKCAPSQNDMEGELEDLIGKRDQQYPPYSSKPIGGKPLYWWARNNKLSEIKIPKKEIEIYSARLLSFKTMDGKDLLGEILKRIDLVKGNFRQDEISKHWKESLSKGSFLVARIGISCSSGTYVRGIAHDLGQDFGCGAFALTIRRIAIGEFGEKDCLPLLP